MTRRFRLSLPHRREDGQILVVFAGAMVAVVAVAGLVLDGGRAFALRRGGQNVADLAAVAGATAYLNASGTPGERESDAKVAAMDIAGLHGYSAGEVTVSVSPILGGATVTVSTTRPQENFFARLVGQPTWTVSTDATAMASNSPNGAAGAMPLIFNEDLWLPGGPEPNIEQAFDLPDPGNEDVPQDPDQFNWTVYCTANGQDIDGDGDPNNCNANSNTVREIIEGFGRRETIYLDDEIAPLNAGAHTALFNALAAHVGKDMPVAVVNKDGETKGWAMFRLTGSTGGSVKQIRGYFYGPYAAPPFTVGGDGPAGNPVFGGYVLKLVD